jgi:hypothetical protein
MPEKYDGSVNPIKFL